MKLRDLFSAEAKIDTRIDPQAEATAVTGLAVDSRAVKQGDLFFALCRQQDRRCALHRGGDRFGRRRDRRRSSSAATHFRSLRGNAKSSPRAGAGGGKILFPAARDDCGRHRHQRQDLGCCLHAADLGTTRPRLGEHRHHRAGVAEAHCLWLADHARSDRAAPPARRDRARRRHASGVRGLIAWSRSVSPRRRAHLGRRLHQSLARPHGLSSRRRALSQCEAPAVPRSDSAWRRGGDLGRSRLLGRK